MYNIYSNEYIDYIWSKLKEKDLYTTQVWSYDDIEKILWNYEKQGYKSKSITKNDIILYGSNKILKKLLSVNRKETREENTYYNLGRYFLYRDEIYYFRFKPWLYTD